MDNHLGHISIHVSNTTTTETLLTVPNGYAFHVEYIRIMNRSGASKSIDLIHNKNFNGYSDTLYIYDDEGIPSKGAVELPDIFLMLYGNSEGRDTLSVVQDGTATFDIIVAGSLHKYTAIIDITGG